MLCWQALNKTRQPPRFRTSKSAPREGHSQSAGHHAKVSQSLDSLRCTRIVIAHRLSTIRQCDRILVLDGGHIIEDGTYNELLAKNGLFAELVARQRVE